MAKKKEKRPNRVSIHYEHLLYDLDFMSNENAGIILKMIVWYAMGDERSKKEIERMEKHIDVLPERPWLTSMYKRLFRCIDEDLEAYAEVCEKRKQAVEKRWEMSKNGIQMNTNVSAQNNNKGNTTYSSGDDTEVCESIQTNTKEYQYNTIQSNTNQSNPIQEDKEEEEEECVREEKIKDAPLRADDFVRIWNAAIAGALRKSETTPMKRLKVEELPSDAELRIHNALNIIERDLSEKDIERVCEEQNLNRAKCSVRDIAKWYMVMAMGRYARVTMKSRDSSFGSFNWFVNYPLRIKKLFNGDIQ